MKKINSLVLSTITAAFLVGCGGGGGGSSTPSTGANTSGGSSTLGVTNVTVERGPVLGSRVTDSKGQIGTYEIGKNIYTFSSNPSYPITATGGIIDVDGNGIDEGDTELTEPLTSYSKVITPITHYLGDITTEQGKERLAKLKEITGVDSDDEFLNKVPSESSNNVLVLANALYQRQLDTNISHIDFLSDYDNSAFKTIFDTLKTEILGLEDKKEIAKKLEEKVIENLGLTTLSQTDIDNLPQEIAKLKIADLTNFVSYYMGGYEFDENVLSSDKLTFKSWNKKYEYIDGESVFEWISKDEYVNITKDATDPYKFSYVDPITKEEGTFTIISTKKLKTYENLYETTAKILVTKQATDINESDAYRWLYPASYPESVDSDNWIEATKIEDLVKRFNRSSFHIGDKIASTSFDGKLLDYDYSTYPATPIEIGTWKIENNYLIAQADTDIIYFRLVLGDEDKYYIEQFEVDAVGHYEFETIYTGTSLEDFISDIKNPKVGFVLNEAMISGKEILTQSGTDTLISQFKEDGSYIEIFNGYKEDCTGTWKLNETSKGTVDIVRVCNNVEGSYQLIFTEEPKDGSQFKSKNTHSEEVITIDTIRDISNDSSSNTEFKSGDTFKGLTYNIVTSSITGKKWLDRNLGATEVCSDSNSSACYGDYYQWGRLADGHEKVDSNVNSTKSSSITNAGSNFIIDSDNTDWTSTDSDKTLRTAQWNKTDGTGICPAGFRVPTIAEFDAEIGAISETKMDNFKNTLKFSESSGYRNSISNGELSVGSNVWSVDLFENKTGAKAFAYSYDSQYPLHTWNGYNLTDGIPVRCIEGK